MTDSVWPGRTAIEVVSKYASGRTFGKCARGPTTGGVALIVSLRMAWAPSMPTHSVEPSSEIASVLGSDPTGIAETTEPVDGSITTIVFGYASAAPGTLA